MSLEDVFWTGWLCFACFFLGVSLGVFVMERRGVRTKGEVERTTLERACKAVCVGCAHDIPITDCILENGPNCLPGHVPPEKFGGPPPWPCKATRIHRLMEADDD